MVRPEWFEKVEDIEVPHARFNSKIINLLLGIGVLMLSALAVFGIVRTIQANNAPSTTNNSLPLPKVSPTSTSRHGDEGEHREGHGEKSESAHEEDDDD